MALSVSMIYSVSGAEAGGFTDSRTGTLQVTVVNENGQVVKDAPVYIFGEHKTRFIGGNQTKGTAVFRMEPGEYRVSSSLVEDRGDYKDRYASHEAHVQIVPGDNASVILTLRALPDPFSLTEDYSQLSRVQTSKNHSL